MLDLIHALRRRAHRARFESACRQVRTTKPLQYRRSDAVTVLSMVGHETLDMYLLAVKSFMVHFSEASLEVLSDGSLTADDRAVLAHHLPGLTISESRDIDTLRCPGYSSWKRLFRIVELSRHAYVVQLDSDTITLGPMVEVHAHAQANRGFMVGESHWSQPTEVSLMRAMASRWTADGPQALMEAVLTDLDFFAPGDTYLHGCAGFCGYPKGSLDGHAIEALSLRIEAHLGHAGWHTWGSEQAMTNCLISKTPQSTVLPWPKYRNFMFPPTNEGIDSATFVHFIGTHRFADATYRHAIDSFYAHYRETR